MDALNKKSLYLIVSILTLILAVFFVLLAGNKTLEEKSSIVQASDVVYTDEFGISNSSSIPGSYVMTSGGSSATYSSSQAMLAQIDSIIAVESVVHIAFVGSELNPIIINFEFPAGMKQCDLYISGYIASFSGVTIENNSENKISFLNGTIGTNSSAGCAVQNNQDGVFELCGGSIFASSGTAIENSGALVISGGSVSATSGTALLCTDGSVSVSSGNINATSGTAFDIVSGAVVISNGTVSATSGIAISNAGNIEIISGTIQADTGVALYNYSYALFNASLPGAIRVLSGNPIIDSGTLVSGGDENTQLIIKQATILNTSTGCAVFCSDTGTVDTFRARINALDGYAIFSADGNVDITISDYSTVNSQTNTAISVSGAASTLKVLNSTISTYGKKDTLFINMSSLTSDHSVIEALGEGKAIVVSGATADISGGTVSSRNNSAIQVSYGTLILSNGVLVVSSNQTRTGTIDLVGNSSNDKLFYFNGGAIRNIAASGSQVLVNNQGNSFSVFLSALAEINGAVTNPEGGEYLVNGYTVGLQTPQFRDFAESPYVSNVELMGHTFVYQWYKLSDAGTPVLLEGQTESALILRNVSDSGTYFAMVSYEVAGLSSEKIISDYISISIAQTANQASVHLDNWQKGQTPSVPTLSTTFVTTAEPKFEYKLTKEGDNKYTTEVPTKPGNYTMRVTYAGDENFSTFSATVEFKILITNGAVIVIVIAFVLSLAAIIYVLSWLIIKKRILRKKTK